jgi:hypothetical protein
MISRCEDRNLAIAVKRRHTLMSLDIGLDSLFQTIPIIITKKPTVQPVGYSFEDTALGHGFDIFK